ncbi:hypothetical protein ACN47E_004534 [Coniothyrium glycines]
MREDPVRLSGMAAADPDAASSEQPPSPISPVPAPAPAHAYLSKPPASRGWLSSVRRPQTSPGPKAPAFKRTLLADDDSRRDSALASSNCTAIADPPTPTSLRRTPSLPVIVVQDEQPSLSATYVLRRRSLDPDDVCQDNDATFEGIDTFIPTGSFDDLTSDAQISFSKRGSMLLGGKKANRRSRQIDQLMKSLPTPSTPQSQVEKAQIASPPLELSPPSAQHLSPRPMSRFAARGRTASVRVLSTDEMTLSRKVRSMYKHGNESAVNWDAQEDDHGTTDTSLVEHSSINETPANASSLTVDRNNDDAASFTNSRHGSTLSKEPTETAGGLEDWTDLEGGEVDRYGFILPKKIRTGDEEGIDGPDEPRIQRVTTVLQLVAAEPRRRGIGRSASRARSVQSTDPHSALPKRHVSYKSVKPTKSSVFSGQTGETRTSHKPLRHATNRLPYNRDRRLRDEASDMLKLPPGLAEVAEQQEGGRVAQALKTKEIERNEKWRKMAKVVQTGADKGGMLFEFDIKDSKLISRTWKGIPDRWRATAWYSFLAASARADKNSPSEEELIEAFYELQAESSAEDVQIDVDVPRTINRHIMFRRRYRGGQRLLFRVLHAMSLYLPDTGYVQGMAPLAATLLCYYEEDRAFVMLVRLWMLRGLERLYEAGFAGLMEALDDFEHNWLREGDVAKKLVELGITSTAYGTRWYLTLFNYSLPFPAQLRVWDVFMLLGDRSYSNSTNSNFSGDLDVLHATSAALIDATREILLDSDFENAMKVLTSWIPIKDEELLMRVAKAEYKVRKKRAGA